MWLTHLFTKIYLEGFAQDCSNSIAHAMELLQFRAKPSIYYLFLYEDMFWYFPWSTTATAAESDGVPVYKFKRWRLKGQALPEVLDQYKSVGAELNVLPFCSQFIPMDVINFPKHTSICYHPSILPRHRGASAINWSVSKQSQNKIFQVFTLFQVFYYWQDTRNGVKTWMLPTTSLWVYAIH